MMNKLFLIYFLLISFTQAKDILSEDMVLISSMKHYPKILEALKNVEAAKMSVQESLGGFDAKLKSKADYRDRGYYDGKSVDVVIEKPLPYMNSKVYLGHKRSDGDFPTYEQKRLTLDSGENRMGIAFSLWQDRDIDPVRLKLRINKLKLTNEEMKVLRSQVDVKQKATKAYWKWVAYGNIYSVLKDLLEIALEREKGLIKRIKQGDLAAIYKTENQKYILKRKTQVIEARQSFLDATLSLSLFLRDEKGNPLIASEKLLPSELPDEKKISQEALNKAKKHALEINPDLITLDNKIKEQQLQESFGQNMLKPRVDLHLEVSNDRGDGSKSLKGQENRGFLKIEIPLERRKGRGIRNKARYMQQSLALKRRLLREQTEVQMQQTLYKLNAAVETIQNTKQEVEFAEILQKAEINKFKNGASDFFVVNIREEDTANAKVKNIKAHLDYKISLANYEAITLASLQPVDN